MPTIDARKLRATYESVGPQQYRTYMEQAVEGGDIQLEDLSLRQCYEQLVPGGKDFLDYSASAGGYIHESIAGVDSTAFYHTFGPPITSIIQNAYEAETDTISSEVPTIQGSDYQKIARVTGLGALGEEVPENGLYPHTGLGEDWILLPRIPKYGVIIPITRETIAKDRTGDVVREAARIGEAAALKREKQLIDLVLGVTNNHNWAGTAYNTYVDSPWDNLMGTAGAFEDYTDLGAIENQFVGMNDPATGEPIVIGGTRMLTHMNSRTEVLRVLNSVEVRVLTGSTITSIGPNPEPDWTVKSTRQLSRAMDAASIPDDTIYAGDFSKAFAIAEDWPLRVDRAPSGSEAEFNQDIPVRFKVSWKSTPVVIEPRAVVKRLVL